MRDQWKPKNVRLLLNDVANRQWYVFSNPSRNCAQTLVSSVRNRRPDHFTTCSQRFWCFANMYQRKLSLHLWYICTWTLPANKLLQSARIWLRVKHQTKIPNVSIFMVFGKLVYLYGNVCTFCKAYQSDNPTHSMTAFLNIAIFICSSSDWKWRSNNPLRWITVRFYFTKCYFCTVTSLDERSLIACTELLQEINWNICGWQTRLICVCLIASEQTGQVVDSDSKTFSSNYHHR